MSHADTARRLAAKFYVAENGNTCVNSDDDDDDDGETVKAMVFQADQYGLGWDFAYEAVCNALQYIADVDEDPADGDTQYEYADSAVDPYTADLVRWLASAPLAHLALCDEAQEEMGAPDADEGLEARLRLGQYHAYRLAMQAVADEWPEDDTEEEDEEDDA